MKKEKKTSPSNGMLIAVILILLCIMLLLAFDLMIVRTIKNHKSGESSAPDNTMLQSEIHMSEATVEMTSYIETELTEDSEPIIIETETFAEITETEHVEVPTDPATDKTAKPIPSFLSTTVVESEVQADESTSYPAPVFQYAVSSSTLEPTVTRKKTYYYDADNVLTSDLGTSWTEGASGDGTGESITVYANGIQRIKQLVVYNGICENKEIFYMNCRIRKCQITLSNGEMYETTLDGDYSAQPCILTFPDAVDTEWVTITILSAYSGTEYEDNGITCLQFVGE